MVVVCAYRCWKRRKSGHIDLVGTVVLRSSEIQRWGGGTECNDDHFFIATAVVTWLGALGPPGWCIVIGHIRVRRIKLRNASEMGLKLPKSTKTGNWRDMNIAQKLWDGAVGSHTWRGSTPHPLNSNQHTPWVKKGCHPNHSYNVVNSWSICKILLLLKRAVNVQQNQYYVTHHTLSVLLHYIGKLKNQ